MPRSEQHRLSNYDYEASTATCTQCGDNSPIFCIDKRRGGWACLEAPRMKRRRPDGSGTPLEQQHCLSEHNTNTRTAICSQCGPGTPIAKRGKGQWACKRKVAEQRKRIRDVIKGRHGLTRGQGRLLAATIGVCQNEGCGVPLDISSRSFTLDHDHDTGEIRGVLCQRCNLALGHLKDDPKRIAGLLNYLNSPPLRLPRTTDGVIDLRE